MRNSIEALKSIYPWPNEIPNVPPNLSGWFKPSKQKLLRRVIPADVEVILELGSWHGMSTAWFLSHAPEATVIAVDTWLGSVTHVLKGRYRRMLPTLYETFLVNCWTHRDRLIPVRNTSLMAMQLLKELKISPDVIYFDADHSWHGLMSELEMAFEFWPGTIMIGDDYADNSVGEVVDGFCSRHKEFTVDTEMFSWYLRRKVE